MALPQEVTMALATAQHIRQGIEGRLRWYGIRAPQTPTQWATEARVTPFRAISGNNDFGTDANDEALVFGSADTPLIAGLPFFSVRNMLVYRLSDLSPYVVRFIYGTGTMAAAEAAGQYSDMMFQNISISPLVLSAPCIPLQCPTQASGVQVWARTKNANNNAWIDFFVAAHAHETA